MTRSSSFAAKLMNTPSQRDVHGSWSPISTVKITNAIGERTANELSTRGGINFAWRQMFTANLFRSLPTSLSSSSLKVTTDVAVVTEVAVSPQLSSWGITWTSITPSSNSWLPVLVRSWRASACSLSPRRWSFRGIAPHTTNIHRKNLKFCISARLATLTTTSLFAWFVWTSDNETRNSFVMPKVTVFRSREPLIGRILIYR